MEEKPSILHRSLFSRFRRVFFMGEYPLSFFEDAFVGLPIAYLEIKYIFYVCNKKDCFKL
jgi:hypothetical protein